MVTNDDKSILVGYKGTSGRVDVVDDAELRSVLIEVFENVGADLMGEHLWKLYKEHVANGADVGYFYCPYIPLMECGVVIDDTTMKPIKIITRYGPVC